MSKTFDIIVLGAGSGGMACATRAAQLGAKVAIVEMSVMGGTCVNVGCVPKKIMWHASEIAETITRSPALGFDSQPPSLHWETLISKRNAYIERARSSYQNKLRKLDIQLLSGQAYFSNKNTINVGNTSYHSAHIVIATGGEPSIPDVPGAHLGITSDGFFELNARPNRVAIIGAGYIALEFAGMLNSLGADTHLFIRHDNVIRSFDPLLSHYAKESLRRKGVTLHTQFQIHSLAEKLGNIAVSSDDKRHIEGFDCVIWAIGRTPRTSTLALEKAGLKSLPNGLIDTNDQYETSTPGIYAIGDITTNAHLTPAAIREGRQVANTLFQGNATLSLSAQKIPSVIFAHPPLASVGLSETDAIKHYGIENLNIYETTFSPMLESLLGTPDPFSIKLIAQGKNEHIVGCHMAGPHADEILQGFAVAFQMNATKADFDNTLAIHPTTSEELVLLNTTHLRQR